MSDAPNHLIVAPILTPLFAGAAMLLIDEKRRAAKATLGVVSILVQLAVATALLFAADAATGGFGGVYRLGDWPAPFAIPLVLDRLSALMLALTAALALACYVYALAGASRAGAYFHSLFQFLLMGLNGAFLTGDLFNLFVFFELLLAASYGLALHGSGPARVKASLHYIAVNLAASLLFLIGVALIYSVTGALNMAEIAFRAPSLSAADRALFEAGAGVLALAFLTKAGMWPLSFWLAPTYGAAVAPAAAMFAIMTKVGVYAVLRLSTLLFGAGAGASSGYGMEAIFLGGVATMLFAGFAALNAANLARLAGACVLLSAGALIAAVGFGRVGVTSGALFYLVGSTLGAAALFLLAGVLGRGEASPDDPAPAPVADGDEDEDEDAGFREDEQVGRVFPASMGLLGFAFLACVTLLAGLPPLSTFFAKIAMLKAALAPAGAAATDVGVEGWIYLAATLATGLFALIALTRVGMRAFWIGERASPMASPLELAPLMALLGLAAALTIWAGPALRYTGDAALALHAPRHYIERSLEPALDRVRRAEQGGGS